MNKPIIIILLTILISSCTEINQTENKIAEMENLRAENDSLKNIIAEIDKKYVFDNVTVREVRNDSNSYKLNSLFKTKYYFVGYNKNEYTYIIHNDSIKSDTLKLNSGGYPYSIFLNKKENEIELEVNAENKFGKKLQAILYDKIQVKE